MLRARLKPLAPTKGIRTKRNLRNDLVTRVSIRRSAASGGHVGVDVEAGDAGAAHRTTVLPGRLWMSSDLLLHLKPQVRLPISMDILRKTSNRRSNPNPMKRRPNGSRWIPVCRNHRMR
jgi:hypothetical protein